MRKRIAVLAVLAAALVPAISGGATPKPTATFTTSPTPYVAGQPVTATPSGTCAATPCTYTWVIKYTVKDAQARSVTTTKTVTANTPPPPPTTTTTTPPPPPPPTTTTTTTPPPPPPPSGGFPDASNTGVPAGTVLSPYTGPTLVTTANTVIDSKTIGCIAANAPGVVIKNSRISCPNSMGFYAVSVGDGPTEGGYTGGAPLTVQDSTISCMNTAGTAIGEANITALRDNISGCENGGDLNQNFLIQDNFVHDMYNSADSHTDGFQMGGGHFVNGAVVKGALNVTFKHNTIFGVGADGSLGTSAIISNPSGDTNVTIDGNQLAGGAFTLYCPRDTKYVNGQVSNNVFSRQFSPKVGAFGPTDGCADENWSNNRLDNGALIDGDGNQAACPSATPNTPGGPDPFGTCFPSAANTGVPFGTVLSAYTGPCTITTANTIIDSKTVNCALTIQAANVTIKNSKVNGNIWLDQDVSGSSGWSMSVTDSEVNSGNQGNYPTICCGMYTVTRVNAYGGLNGGDCEFNNQYCTITDSYYHDPYQPPTTESHLGGFRVGGGTNITINHNTIWCNPPVNADGGGCTGDINLLPFAGSTINGALVKNNLLPAEVGGSFCTYTGTDNGINIVYDGNVFQRGPNRKCAVYGAVSSWQAGTGNLWKTNNIWDDGVAVNPLTD